LALAALALCACASTSPSTPPPSYAPEKDAITLHLIADPQLNVRDGVPHTLFVCFYQLRDPNAFNQFAGDKDGLYKLLGCSLFDGSVVNSRSQIVNPGQDMKLIFDRAEGAKYVGIVAGYYLLQGTRNTRLIDFPVIQEKKGWISRTISSKVGKLDLEIHLGPQQIEEIDKTKAE